ALTYYVAHIVGFLAVVLIGGGEYSLWIFLVVFIVIPMVFAAVWFRFFRRGPLEAVMYSAARRASGPRPARQEDKVPATSLASPAAEPTAGTLTAVQLIAKTMSTATLKTVNHNLSRMMPTNSRSNALGK